MPIFRPALLLVLLVGCAQGPDPIDRIERLDPRFDALVPADAELEILAQGFRWTEGPVWVRDGGYLLFSDTDTNTIHRYDAEHGAVIWLNPSGYTARWPRGGGMGSNGLAIDAQGRLALCQHGDRRVAVLEGSLNEPGPRFRTVVDRYDGRRLNSPNDLVFDAEGALYFTDPPYGLAAPDSAQLDFSGVYRWSAADGVELLDDGLSRPNGIALSPDGSKLYVANSDRARAIWMVYDVTDDGGVANGRVFADVTDQMGPERPGAPDGLKVDALGNLFATGPGGVWVFSPEGDHLGTIRTGVAAANVAFGDDGRSLYITATGTLQRILLTTVGFGFDG